MPCCPHRPAPPAAPPLPATGAAKPAQRSCRSSPPRLSSRKPPPLAAIAPLELSPPERRSPTGPSRLLDPSETALPAGRKPPWRLQACCPLRRYGRAATAVVPPDPSPVPPRASPGPPPFHTASGCCRPVLAETAPASPLRSRETPFPAFVPLLPRPPPAIVVPPVRAATVHAPDTSPAPSRIFRVPGRNDLACSRSFPACTPCPGLPAPALPLSRNAPAPARTASSSFSRSLCPAPTAASESWSFPQAACSRRLPLLRHANR